MQRWKLLLSVFVGIAWCLSSYVAPASAEDTAATFRAGYARADITPPAPSPMWGYGARHDMLSQGALDPLYAAAIVLEAGHDKLAIVGLDLGRGPTRPMMEVIRRQVKDQAGIGHVIVAGSHTHHGPVIELTAREGFGKGKFDDAVAYSERLPDSIVKAIVEANGRLEAARIGVATTDIPYNRNRHTKRTPKPTDPRLHVLRIDNLEGKPLAILVNFAAHPVTTDATILKFSADYPGYMKGKVERELGGGCVFMQGASGDMSVNPPEGVRGPQAFGEALADRAIELAKSIETAAPRQPSIAGLVDHFQFRSRVDFSNPIIAAAYERAFFPELVRNFFEEMREGVRAELDTVLINGEIAIVSGSGEFFANHAVRLRDRAYVKHTLFFGYANGHDLYYPTIEAVSEGGYGADMQVSPVEIGAGEQMMNRALINLYTLLGKFPPQEQQ